MNTIDTEARPAAGQIANMIDSAAVPAPEAEPEPRPPEPPAQSPPTPRRPWWISALWLSSPFIALLAWWKFAALKNLFFDALPYTQAVAFTSIGVIGLLYKDTYRHHGARRAALCLFVLLGCLMALNTYRERDAAQQAGIKTAGNFDGVNGRLDGLKKDLGDRVDKAGGSVGTLTDRFDIFEKKVRPDELRGEMNGMKTELENTQKALNPPKVTLLFSFIPLKVIHIDAENTTGEPVTEKTLTRTEDGSLHIEFTVLNLTDIDALDGEMTLQICDDCTFAKEPSEFKKLPGQDDHQRNKTFDRILSKVAFYTMSADINVSPLIRDIPIGMYFRCRTCVRQLGPERIMIHTNR
jgi:hypothetical protein